ncbi:MAG: glycosyl hydrolase family 28 protein [Mariniphaga sp.]|nr:glycosyl hydrolase family 28 protein [Mariniphaga sp.]
MANTKSINRRALLQGGAAMLGAGMLGSFTTAASSSTEKTPDQLFNVKKFGASGDRDQRATLYIRQAIEACAAAGGGIVYVPPGEYTVGTLQLRDNITLYMEAGATFFLSQLPEDFIRGARSMIFAENANNISVKGKGTFDGLAQYVYEEMNGIDRDIAKEIEIAKNAGVDMRRYYRSSSSMNTYMVIINDCTNVLLEDISIINSPLWTIRFTTCDRIFVRGVYIYSDLEKGVNADGIDICSSSNVVISDSVIITGDDCIVLKTRSLGEGVKVNPVENVVVTNCILTSSSTPLMIGTETFADFRHIIFSNCTIRDSNKGFGINVQDGATVSDVIITNLTIEENRRHWNWWGSAEMCKFILLKRNELSRLGKIQNVVVNNIVVHARGTSTITGHPDQPIENIRMTNLQIFMDPENTIDKRTGHAIKFENVKELRVRDLSVKWSEDRIEKAWQSALALENVMDAEIRYFSGRQGLKSSDIPAIRLTDVSEVLISESRATEGCGTFVHVQGDSSNEIILKGNYTKKARKKLSFENDRLKSSVTSD